MKKILSGILSMAMLFSTVCSMIIAPSVVTAEGEPEKAAVVIFDGGFKNNFTAVKWGSPGTVTEEGGKLLVTMKDADNEVKVSDDNTYFSGADWAADGAIVMDANLTSTLDAGTSSKFSIKFDVYYRKPDGSYTGSNPDSGYWMSLTKDDLCGEYVQKRDSQDVYDRLCIYLDRNATSWTNASGGANLADPDRYLKSFKFQVENDGTKNDTVLIDKFALAHTSATSVDSIKYYTADGMEVPSTGSSLALKPDTIKIKVKNFGLVDDKTLDGVTINGLTAEKSFDMSTNTIILKITNPDSIQLNQSYQVNVSNVKVYGGNAVENMSASFTVADSTSLEGYKLYDYADGEMNDLITTDLEKIELSFSNTAVDPATLSNIALYTETAATVPVEAVLAGNKVTVTIKGDLEDNTKYTLMIKDVLKTTSGEAVLCENITFNTQNTVVFFDDALHGLTLSNRDVPNLFTHEVSDAKNVTGGAGASIHHIIGEGGSGQFQWKFDENIRDWTQYYNENWSFTYWMTADNSAADTPFEGKTHKIPYWHTPIINGGWFGMPTGAGSAVHNYSFWADSDMYTVGDDEWVYLAFPLKEVDNASNADWTKVAEIAGGPSRKGENIYFDELKLVANTRIVPKSITLKNEGGSVLNSTKDIEPASIEVAFTGNLDRNTVKDGIKIEDSQGGTVSYDYVVDYMKSVVTVTPKGEYKAGETYTVKIDGLKAFGGSGQKRTLEKAFTTPTASAVITYYNDTAEVGAGEAFNKVVVNATVAESVEKYTIYLAVYKGNVLENVYIKQSTDENPTELTAELGRTISLSDYKVKAFIWEENMKPLL